MEDDGFRAGTAIAERRTMMPMTKQVRWGLLRPGATVVGEHENDGHKVVTVEHRGTTVSVLFWDGTRERHGEDAYARVLLNNQTCDRAER
jgi:hypothetical protein